MHVVQTPHAPGAVVMCTGEMARFASSLQCYHRIQVPNGSLDAWHAGVLVAENLNRGLDAMMAQPSLEWAFLMGDDHTYSPDILLKLLDREMDVVVPLCLNRYPPMDPSIMTPSGQKHLEALPTEGLYKLAPDETCGDAGLLVRRNVLEKLERPYYDTQRSGSFKSEDQSFVQKVMRAGFDVWIDCDNTIGHIAAMDVRPVVKNGKWVVRLMGGFKHVVDLAPVRKQAA